MIVSRELAPRYILYLVKISFSLHFTPHRYTKNAKMPKKTASALMLPAEVAAFCEDLSLIHI